MAAPAASTAAAMSAAHLHIVDYEVRDVRFPTNVNADGTDAMNKECDYSAAYLILYAAPKGTPRPTRQSAPDTDRNILKGYGMTFTIGRGNEICCAAIESLVRFALLDRPLEPLLDDMGKTWELLVTDCQLRWIGPEKGVIHLASAAAVNAVWDLYARLEGKPLWQLISDMTPEQVVSLLPLRYLSDALTRDEALAMLRDAQPTKAQRAAELRARGYPAYTTAAGWSGYPDDKVARLTREALAQGFSHFKFKVGSSLDDDRRRLALVRSILDDAAAMPEGWVEPKAEELVGKNAGPTGCVLMIDANQVFDVDEAIEYVSKLAEFRPWFIEEPTSPDDVLGHAAIRRGLRPHGVGVATGEHCQNRVVFKQLLQAGAVDVVQVDACRLAGPNENLAVMLMAKKFGALVCPHAGGVGLNELVRHMSMIDYVLISQTWSRQVCESVARVSQGIFRHPATLSGGRYDVPTQPGYDVEMLPTALEDYEFPGGRYWATGVAKAPVL